MNRRGGKMIKMDDPPQLFGVSHDDNDDEPGDSAPVGRMTRLRARGGVRDKPPIIDDEEDEIEPVIRKRRLNKKAAGAAGANANAYQNIYPSHQQHQPRVTHREYAAPVQLPSSENDGRPERDVTQDETSLYYIVRNSKHSISAIVDNWIESYKQDRTPAMIALMQFFINASGCKGRITQQMQANMEYTDIIRTMTEEFAEDSGEYPLIMSGAQWKKFKISFTEFVQTLVRQCQYSIIYDQYLVDNLISLLTGLSDSQVRAFRHTATLAAMKLMTALVDVALLVGVNYDNIVRQIETEKMKGGDKQNPRMVELTQRQTGLEDNMDEIKNMLTYMFKSVFVHRYRDTLYDIRAICMTEIGHWMSKFSQNFLDDSYLKYIGWTLHDKIGEVRLRCIQALLPLYENEQFKAKLELFTSKFKDRIINMTLDKEYEVSVHAVKLVINILKMHPDILTDKDCEFVYELVYSSYRGVAQAAAEFLNIRLFHLQDQGEMGIQYTSRGKRRLPNTPLIRDLVQFFIESELHEHAAYLVDSFIDNNAMVKDWECMTDLLLEEPGPSEEALDNKQESSLIEIMVCAVKQSATGEAPVGRSSNRKVNLSAKDVKQVKDDKHQMTEHFIPAILKLLDTFAGDHEKLANLLSIPQYFDLQIYTTTRQEAHLKALLDKIAYFMTTSTDSDVLETCTRTLQHLCRDDSSVYTKCDGGRTNIIDQAVNNYREAIDVWRTTVASQEQPDAEQVFNLELSLKKIAVLVSCHNMSAWNLFDSIFNDLRDYKNYFMGASTSYILVPINALISSVTICYDLLNWQRQQLEFGVPGYNPSDIRRQLNDFLYTCFCIIGTNGVDEQILSECYTATCDLMLLFSPHTEQKVTFEPIADQIEVLLKFVQVNVIAASNNQEALDEFRKIEKLHKRRSYLAAYAKLIIYNAISIQYAADIFRHYVKYYNDYGDIIKMTVAKTREINKVSCAMVMSLALIRCFTDFQQRCGGIVTAQHRTQSEFNDLKELAKRFALSFGLDAIKNREAIIPFHRSAILFVMKSVQTDSIAASYVAPPNISYFEIANEFVNKLLRQDKKFILEFLDRRIKIPGSSVASDDWQPLITYRNTLLHHGGDVAPNPTEAMVKRPYLHKKSIDHTDYEDDDGDVEMNN